MRLVGTWAVRDAAGAPSIVVSLVLMELKIQTYRVSKALIVQLANSQCRRVVIGQDLGLRQGGKRSLLRQ